MEQKIFPIKTATACQLKWSHSTVFLTELTTASCHRVAHDKFNLDQFDFHNTPEKLQDRTAMLNGQWPGRGCEHCKNIEDVGGTSDRMLHLDFQGFRAPPELDNDLTATHVTPRILEIYFSNTCNLKCVYCTPRFSSQINQENKKYGSFNKHGVSINSINMPSEFRQATDRMFEWLESNVHSIDKLIVLGGEPFIQKETDRLLKFLSTKTLPNLSLIIFSNLTIEHEKFKQYAEKLSEVKQAANLHQINIIGSLDCWGAAAEYVRSGLDLALFEQNFLYLLDNTDFVLNINSALTPLTVGTLPALVEKINLWSKTRLVYWTLMKTSGRSYLHPTIFGDAFLSMGYQQSVDLFDPIGDPEKTKYKEYFNGILDEIKNSKPDLVRQEQLKIYLTELDRRRGTDYKSTFPWLNQYLDLVGPEGFEPPTYDFEDRNSIQLS